MYSMYKYLYMFNVPVLEYMHVICSCRCNIDILTGLHIHTHQDLDYLTAILHMLINILPPPPMYEYPSKYDTPRPHIIFILPPYPFLNMPPPSPIRMFPIHNNRNSFKSKILHGFCT